MANTDDHALKFFDSVFKNNRADQNLIHLLLSEMYIESSTFTDNWALFVNHGITLITSSLEIRESNITFTEGFADTLNLE